MSVPQKNAGDRFNGSQAKELSVLGAARFELGRPMEMPRGPLDSQTSQPIPTQGQQGFLGSKQGSAFAPMQGSQTPRLQPRPAAPPPQQPQMAGDEEAHTIDVQIVGPNGEDLMASFDAIAPRGSRVLGAQERR